MPFTPPSIPWSSLQQAMEAQARINKMMPAIEAAMRNSEVIQAGAKQLEEYHAMQPYIEEAMQAQEAFNKSKEDFTMYHEHLASMGVEPPYASAIPPSLLLDAADAQRALELYQRSVLPLPEYIPCEPSTLTVLADTVSFFSSQVYITQISPWIGEVITDRPKQSFREFFYDCQQKCSRTLLEAHWCPSVLLSLPLKKLVPICELSERNEPFEKKETALNQFIFHSLGIHFTDSLLERWKVAPIPNHIKRLLKETLYAYRRKENGLVVGVLPTLWEGFIREKAAIEKKPSSKELRDAVAKLVEENQSSSTISAFYDTCVMYPCHSPEEAKPDVPGRHAVAHGWFERYPTKKAALNAILFTDFLLRLKQF